MNRRHVMYRTNRLARTWLLQNDYDMIWLKPHLDNRKIKDFYYTKNGTFQMTDIYNLFDGLCFDQHGTPTFLQISTTNFHPEGPYQEFIKDKACKILLIKVVKKNGKSQVQAKNIKSKRKQKQGKFNTPCHNTISELK